MAGTSITAVNAKIIADAQQLINEFQRAHAATKSFAQQMDREVDSLTRGLKKKFSAADIGKDIMKGLGIGSGFALAETAANKVVDYYREQAEYAKQIEESTKRQLDYTLQLLGLRQTDAQKVQALQKQIAGVEREQAAITGQTQTVDVYQLGQKVGERTIAKPLSDEELVKLHALSEELKRLNLERAKLEKSINDRETTGALENQSQAVRRLGGDFSVLQGAIAKTFAAMDEHEDKLKDMADKYRDLGDPMRQYETRLKEIDMLEQRGSLTADEAFAARVKVWGDRADAINQMPTKNPSFGDLKSGEYGLTTITEETDQLARAARDMGFAFASAFEDAVLAARSMGDIIAGLAQDIARMMLRLAIVNPIMNSVFGFTGANALPTLLGARAEGGPVTAGGPYLVGEKGPELFVPGSSGTVIPNHKLGGGEGAVSVTYNIGAGVTASQLGPILALHKREILGTIADAKRRRTGLSAALA